MTIEVRNYLSWNLLYSGRHLAAMAAEREAMEGLPSPIDQRERAYVLSTIVTAVTFLDAVINEVFQDAADGPDTSYSRRMPMEVRERFSSAWRLIHAGRSLSTLERFEMALLLADAEMLDRGVNPFQDAATCIQLRNWIAHYRPQQLGRNLAEPGLSARMQGKFASNSLMKGQGNVWFPDHALGAGCAAWAITSARAFADECMDRLNLEPIYRSVDEHEPTPETL